MEINQKKMLREIANDDITPKNTILLYKTKFTKEFAMIMTMMTGNMVLNHFMNQKSVINKIEL